LKRLFLRSKVSGLTATDCRLDYDGSLTLDGEILNAAGIEEFEWVHVLNRSTGARFETYVIRGPEGSGQVVVNGPAARLAQRGDGLVVLCPGLFGEAEERPKPTLVTVNEKNRIPRAP
jgi:aspartate 1-decarboxylase